jgi:hypothetical protein
VINGSDCHGRSRSQARDFYFENPTNIFRRYEKEENFQRHGPIVKISPPKIFSDEKIFTVEASVNFRNSRWLAHDPDDMPVIPRIKFPASVRILGVATNEGDVPPPPFFKSETDTKERYLDIFSKRSCGSKKKLLANHTYSNKTVHSLIIAIWYKFVSTTTWAYVFRSNDFWPPNSIDLNPLDYYICSIVEKDTNKSRHPNIASLQKAIQAISRKLQREGLKRACQCSHPTLEAVIHNGEGYR